VLNATGTGPDGVPLVGIGLSAVDCVQLLAHPDGIVIDTANLDPRLPRMKILVFAGETDEALAAQVQASAPNVWRADLAEEQALRDHGRASGPAGPDEETRP